MNNVFGFITKRGLFVNIIAAIALSALMLFLILESFDFFTQHNKKRTIPDVIGKSYTDAVKILAQQGFEVEIQDSVFFDSLPRLSVIKQFPDPEAVVKINRTVFLTINRAIPPEVAMPQVEGLTLRSAEMVLKSSGLRLGDTSYRPDFARNSVLEQHYKGQRITYNTKIRMGSAIDLVLGAGITEKETNVPDLFGLSYAEAKGLLEADGIIPFPVPDPDVRDTSSSFVYKQDPPAWGPSKERLRIRSGMSINIFLGTNRPERDTTSHP